MTNESPAQPSSVEKSLERIAESLEVTAPRIAESLEAIALFLHVLAGDQEEPTANTVMTQNGPVELR